MYLGTYGSGTRVPGRFAGFLIVSFSAFGGWRPFFLLSLWCVFVSPTGHTITHDIRSHMITIITLHSICFFNDIQWPYTTSHNFGHSTHRTKCRKHTHTHTLAILFCKILKDHKKSSWDLMGLYISPAAKILCMLMSS